MIKRLSTGTAVVAMTAMSTNAFAAGGTYTGAGAEIFTYAAQWAANIEAFAKDNSLVLLGISGLLVAIGFGKRILGKA